MYGTCISNNKFFGGEAKGLIGISGIFIGVGEILGEYLNMRTFSKIKNFVSIMETISIKLHII